MKHSFNILFALLISIGLFSCTSGSGGDTPTPNDDTVTSQEVTEPIVSQEVVDSIETKVDELESELDDILDGLD